ncbi:HPP family protein [Tautonia plasticadhaerens]|uniref:HPP family protein n=1 Tax=Tautonia plasticadhaerens TaxID=2527974 RepID=UPI0018D21066|nr:HPP family protein [Tautonia plasticadhaerens]
MVATIVLMIALDVVHPPAVSTSLAFAFRAGDAGNVTLFALAVGITALLVVLQRAALWQLVRLRRRRPR